MINSFPDDLKANAVKQKDKSKMLLNNKQCTKKYKSTAVNAVF